MHDDETTPAYSLWSALGERRYRDEVSQRESQIRAELVVKVREAIYESVVGDAADADFDVMAEAAVDALADYYRAQLNLT